MSGAPVADALTGSCLCGGVQYVLDAPPVFVANCHCTKCRKSTGAAFSTGGHVMREDFHLKKGADLLRVFTHADGKDRVFCSTCGSTILTGQPWPDGPVVRLRMGTLDGDPHLRPHFHFFTGSKAPWFEITDDLPQYEAGVEA